MTITFGRAVTYIEGHLPVKSHDPLITQFCEIADKLKLLSPTLQYI